MHTAYMNAFRKVKEEKELTSITFMGSKSDTLHLVGVLQLPSPSNMTPRQPLNLTDKPTKLKSPVVIKRYEMDTVGVKLVSDIDLEVPVFDIFSIEPKRVTSENLHFLSIPANQEFSLNLYELMLLVYNEAYSGVFSNGATSKGVELKIKRSSDTLIEDNVLPVPRLVMKELVESQQDDVVAVKNGNKVLEVLPEYKDKFSGVVSEYNKKVSKVMERGAIEPQLDTSLTSKTMRAIRKILGTEK